MGNYGYFRNSLSGVFGNREKGFLHFVGSYRTNQGFAAGLESEAYAYYLKGRKTVGNHNLSFTTCSAHRSATASAPIKCRSTSSIRTSPWN